MKRTHLYHSTLAACAVLLFAGRAFADPPPSALHPHVEEYTRKYQLPKRVVKISTPGVSASRTFVPVITDEHHADFQDRFSKRNGAITVQVHDTAMYPTIRMDAQSNYWRNSESPGGWTIKALDTKASLGAPKRYIAAELDPGHIEGVHQFLTNVKTIDLWKAANPGHELKVSSSGQCMWWFGNIEAGNKQSLWHVLGVRRSIAPENLVKKLMHAGNHRVSTIGVPVASIEAFNAMTDAELLGDKPVGGEIDAVKEH